MGDYAIINIKEGDRKISYTHRNRLGSASLITDGDRHVDNVSPQSLIQERRGFDPFGKARDVYWGDSLNGLLASSITSRGFTDHEHLDDVELIHMNGRAYDYNLGRFLSVDPFISFPKNSQAVNPYSYIMNNPLSGTDPSGYEINKRVGRTKEAIKKASKGWVTVADNGSLVSPGYTFTVGGGSVGDIGNNSGVLDSTAVKTVSPVAVTDIGTNGEAPEASKGFANEYYSEQDAKKPWTQIEAESIDKHIDDQETKARLESAMLAGARVAINKKKALMKAFGIGTPAKKISDGLKQIADKLRTMNANQLLKMTNEFISKFELGTDTIAAEYQGRIYVSKTFVSLVVTGNAGNILIHEIAHFVGMQHRLYDSSKSSGIVMAGIYASSRSADNRLQTRRNPYNYELYLSQ